MLGTSERNSPGTRTQFTGNQGTSVRADRRLYETARSWRECPASPGCSVRFLSLKCCQGMRKRSAATTGPASSSSATTSAFSTSLARILDRGFARSLLVRCIRLFHGISADPVNLVHTVMTSDKLFGQDFYRSVFAGVATDGVRHADRRHGRSHRCRTGRQSLHRPRSASRQQRRTSPPGRMRSPGSEAAIAAPEEVRPLLALTARLQSVPRPQGSSSSRRAR